MWSLPLGHSQPKHHLFIKYLPRSPETSKPTDKQRHTHSSYHNAIAGVLQNHAQTFPTWLALAHSVGSVQVDILECLLITPSPQSLRSTWETCVLRFISLRGRLPPIPSYKLLLNSLLPPLSWSGSWLELDTQVGCPQSICSPLPFLRLSSIPGGPQSGDKGPSTQLFSRNLYWTESPSCPRGSRIQILVTFRFPPTHAITWVFTGDVAMRSVFCILLS